MAVIDNLCTKAIVSKGLARQKEAEEEHGNCVDRTGLKNRAHCHIANVHWPNLASILPRMYVLIGPQLGWSTALAIWCSVQPGMVGMKAFWNQDSH